MSEKGFFKSKFGIAVIAIAIVGVGSLVGVFVLNSLNNGPTTDFYVVSYHWGFTFYDEEFNEVQNITVNQSTHVRIFLLSANGLTEELHESFEERTLTNGIGGETDPTIIMNEMESAEENGFLDHGIAFLGAYGSKGNIRTNTGESEINATSIQDLASKLKDLNELPVLDFIADTKGNFDIYCTVPCGDYHSAMIIEKIFNVL